MFKKEGIEVKNQKQWKKPVMEKININETKGGTKGNGEHKPTHKPKWSS